MIPTGRVYYDLDRRFPLVTVLLVLGNIAAFLWQCSQGIQLIPCDAHAVQALFTQALDPNDAMEQATRALGSVPVELAHGMGLWKVFTSMFLHANLSHIVGNLLFLSIFAPLVEDRLGRGRFLALYLLCGIGADAGEALTDLTSTTYTIGASGAISGVAGAALWLFPKEPLYTNLPLSWGGIGLTLPIRVPTWLCLLSWMGYQVASISHQWAGTADVGDAVAYAAHVAGFAVGMGLALLFAPTT